MKIFIPTPLRAYTDKKDTVDVAAATVGDAFAQLTTLHPELRPQLFNIEGKLRSFVNVYLNDDDIRYLDQKEATHVSDSDTLTIIPSIAGGSASAVAELAELPTLSNDEIARYSRHLLLPEVGLEGQRKLKAARVLCVGTGGLGSPLALYLAAAGIGTLGLVDFDVVDASNLQRQIIHSTKDVGRPKIDSAEEKLKGLNPHMNIIKFETMLTSANALEIMKDFDVIADGTDNFQTRYLVNDACVLLGKPNAYGSIFRFEGQASVFGAKDGPCYRCLYPEPPPPGLVPSCAEGGVLGILPGLVGIIQATETIKLILGIGEPLIGRLLLVDALGMNFRTLKLRKNKDCPVCGTHPTVTELIDYDQFCGILPKVDEAPVAVKDGISQLSVEQLKQKLDAGERPFILDVREPHEFQIVNMGGYLLPLGEVVARLVELEEHREREIVIHCKTGRRSQDAAHILREAGFSNIHNLAGGIQAWAEKIDTSLPKY